MRSAGTVNNISFITRVQVYEVVLNLSAKIVLFVSDGRIVIIIEMSDSGCM